MHRSGPHRGGIGSARGRLAGILFSSAVIAFSALVPAPPATAVDTCSEGPAGTVTVTIGPDETATLSVGEGGIIQADGGNCTGDPTNTTTTTYIVTGDSGGETFVIDQSGTAQFDPAADFAVDLMGERGDTLGVMGTPEMDTVTIGANGVDLKNDGDLDVTLAGVEAAFVRARAGNDFVSGAGSAITGAATSLPLTLNGGASNDTLIGGDGDDALRGGDDDMLKGGKGADVLRGGEGDDLLKRGKGDDVVYGGKGDNVLYGGPGKDVLYGGPGKDILYSGPGDDVLFGGPGSDELIGGRGNDTCHGGPGADSFVGCESITL